MMTPKYNLFAISVWPIKDIPLHTVNSKEIELLFNSC